MLFACLKQNSIAWFIAVFAILFGIFYGTYYALVGFSAPGGYYIPWLQKINYLDWFRVFLLKASAIAIQPFGYDSILTGFDLQVTDGVRVRMAYACTGYSIMCFWWAFVLSYPQTAKAKAVYFFVGTAAIILINITRVAALAILFTKYGINSNIDHHLLFNIAVYAVLAFMIYKWVNEKPAMQKTAKA